MKKTAVFAIGIASFVGVLGALQADRFIDRNRTADVLSSKGEFSALPVAFEPAAAGTIDFRAAAKRVNSSVVSVDRYQRVPRFMGEGGIQETGTGSGVIISDTGIIITNNHVVAGRETTVKVRLSDKRVLDAKVLGTDPRSDLAVLQVSATNLKAVELGSSSNLEIGQWVMAVGNPLGFDNTVSVGVVSSLKRNLPVGQQGIVDAIQTDAAINPGNSGGALCDSQGRLIGINTAIASSTGQSVGIGFAIPVDRVKKIAGDIVKFGSARYAGLGVLYDGEIAGQLEHPYVREALADMLKRADFPTTGLFVRQTSGVSKSAGIKPGDFLLAIDGEKIETSFDLNRILISKKPGDKVKVKFWQEGATKEVTIALQEIAPSA